MAVVYVIHTVIRRWPQPPRLLGGEEREAKEAEETEETEGREGRLVVLTLLGPFTTTTINSTMATATATVPVPVPVTVTVTVVVMVVMAIGRSHCFGWVARSRPPLTMNQARPYLPPPAPTPHLPTTPVTGAVGSRRLSLVRGRR